jgi:zinc/manganese transport system substrate-binding protein
MFGNLLLRRIAAAAAIAVALVAFAVVVSGCGSSLAQAQPGKILAVGAENEYANVIAQIGGRYVQVSAVMSNPNTDPHTFEASPAVAQEVGRAQLVVQNGVGYDDFMSKIESASSNSDRKVVDVQSFEHLPDSTPDPHLWYRPSTMPLVTRALVADLSALARPTSAQTQRGSTAACSPCAGRWRSSRPTIRTPPSRPPSRWRTICCRPPTSPT